MVPKIELMLLQVGHAQLHIPINFLIFVDICYRSSALANGPT